MLKIFGEYVGNIWGICLGYVGDSLGICWGYLEYLGIVWKYLGICWAPFDSFVSFVRSASVGSTTWRHEQF